MFTSHSLLYLLYGVCLKGCKWENYRRTHWLERIRMTDCKQYCVCLVFVFKHLLAIRTVLKSIVGYCFEKCVTTTGSLCFVLVQFLCCRCEVANPFDSVSCRFFCHASLSWTWFWQSAVSATAPAPVGGIITLGSSWPHFTVSLCALLLSNDWVLFIIPTMLGLMDTDRWQGVECSDSPQPQSPGGAVGNMCTQTTHNFPTKTQDVNIIRK